MSELREIVDKLANGFFEYECGKLSFSMPKIEASIPPGQLYEGSFTIKSATDTLTKGHIYTSSMRLVCRVDYFEDSEKEIPFVFDPTGLEAGDVVKGDIQIVSSAGEYYIPFVFSVVHVNIESTLGTVRNLFHFTNQAQLNWNEAVSLFYSPEFKRVFEGNDRVHYEKYLGFLNAAQSEMSVDSFLVAVNKKQPVTYSLDRYAYEFRDVIEEMRCEITLHKSSWGYIHLDVSSDNDFVTIEKPEVTENDFLGNEYKLVFFVSDEALHEGDNYAAITITAPGQELKISIVASKRKHSDSKRERRLERKKLICKLMRKYLAFRMHKINANSWVRDSLKIVERLNAVDEKDPISRLFQAQLLLVEERYNEANWILEHVANEMNIHTTGNATYCYYLYLTTLYRRDEDYVNQIAVQVNSIYEQDKKSYLILWTLLFLDEEMSQSDSKKLAAIERRYESNCFSPILYLEAYNCYVNSPSLLNKLTDFELQVLWLMIKNGRLSREVADQLAYLASRQRAMTPRLRDVLIGAYKLYPEPVFVEAITTILIREDRRREEDFIWYLRAVQLDLRITRLYEYFMYSIPITHKEQLPKQVYMYFGYKSELNDEKKAFLYASMIAHKKELPELYESYKEQMLLFAAERIEEEKIDASLAEIYKDVLFAEMIKPDMAQNLSKLIFARELFVPEDEYVSVIVIQEQLESEAVYPIKHHRAYPCIYSEQSTVFLEKSDGQRCLLDLSKLKKLMNENTYVPIIKNYVNHNLPFIIYLAEGKKSYITVDSTNADLCRELVESDEVRESYKRDIRMALLHYYYENDQMVLLEEFLFDIKPRDLNAKDRSELINFYVLRSMYDEAYELLTIYGTEEVNAKTCVKVCSQMVGKKDRLPDAMLVKVCYHAFKQGKYDSQTLQYLVDYFDGLTKELRDLWRAAMQFDLDCYALTEKLIIQMLFTRTSVGEKEKIFSYYLSLGASTKVELAYLSYCAYDYFTKERLTDDSVFEHLVDNYRLDEHLNDACKLALLKYYAEEVDHYSERIKDMLRIFLNEYMHRNMYFRFFSNYVNILPELASFEDKAIIEYRTNPTSRVVIHYILEESDSGEDIYRTEEMRNMFGGVFSKEFILFYGENLQYYITEEKGGREQLTVSDSLSISDVSTVETESRYSMLNDMVVSKTLRDDETLMKLMEEYVQADYFTEQIFTIR